MVVTRCNDICPGNIWSGNTCPYWQYLGCYWSNSDQTLTIAFRGNLFQMPYVRVTFVKATFVLEAFVHTSNSSSVPDLIFIKLFGPTFLGGKNCFRPKFCYIQTFIIPKVFGPIFFWTYIFLDQIFCKFIFITNIFLAQIFFYL